MCLRICMRTFLCEVDRRFISERQWLKIMNQSSFYRSNWRIDESRVSLLVLLENYISPQLPEIILHVAYKSQPLQVDCTLESTLLEYSSEIKPLLVKNNRQIAKLS